ncbi:MAG: DUF429 domain-containing protein [Deltaproteobacteria bacterium]|nr:DUF429 domain-containing protein [Deltaproteobacteria bacterium]MDZ4345805.1 DUF429 domain-containing protein [Candidatus Binatia bacterium]
MALNALLVSERDRVWIGADPGGKKNFGLAILKADGSARTWGVDCADEAVNVIVANVKSFPAGVGVDAPLWWSSGQSSDREADKWLRKKYRLIHGEVQASNSLKGAALVQGIMFVQRMRERFPAVGVTESHPKAVLAALKMRTGRQFFQQFSVEVKNQDNREHERDAVISAVASREGFEGRWLKDLSTNCHSSEQDPSRFWLAPIQYFWPET